MIEFKKIKVFLIMVLIIPILVLIGFSTWIITNKLIIKPDIEVNKVLTEYLNSQKGTYNGNVLLPNSDVIGVVSDGRNTELTYYYKEKNSSNEYIECVDSNTSIGPINAGEYLIKVKYIVNDTIYTIDNIAFKINKAIYDMSNITFNNTSKVYNRENQIIECNGTLPKGVTVTYEGFGKNVGEYPITASFTGDTRNYEAIPDKTAILTITPKDISECRIYFSNVDITTDDGKHIYLNGTTFEKISNGLTILDNDSSLIINTDYVVEWGEYNLSAGSENTTTISGTGNYTGTSQIAYFIEALTLRIEEIKESGSLLQQVTFDGLTHYPLFKVLDQYNNEIDLNECIITYTNSNNETITPINASRYTVKIIVTYKNSTSNPTNIDLLITPANIKDAIVSLNESDKNKVYTAKAISVNPIIKFTLGDNSIANLINGQDYTLSFANNENVGTATINISGKGNYTGNTSMTFNITKATLTLSTNPTLNSFVGSYQAEISNGGQVKGVNGKEVIGIWSYDTRFINETNTSPSWQVNVIMTFVPTDSNVSDNYNQLQYTATAIIEAVCQKDSTYYSRIEYALNQVSSGTIYCLIGKNPYIRENCTIKSGVTLTLPYDGTTFKNREGSGTSFADKDPSSITKNLKNTVYIENNLVLTNNGTINIGGIVGCAGTGIQAQTSGSYTQFILNENAIINNNNEIYCLGYIKESYKNNGSKVNGIKGNIYIPMVLYDFRGGSITTDVYQDTFPITQFDFPNIQSLLVINYGCTLTGYTDVYFGTFKTHYPSEPTLISSSNAIFILSNNSYVEMKYNGATFKNNQPCTDSSFSNNYTNTQLLDIYGSGSIGNCSLTITVGIISKTIDTKNYYLPISSRLNIKIHKNENNDCQFNLPYKVAMLTGSSLSVDQGITVNNSSSLLICTTYIDPISSTVHPYPSQSPASFIMNGTFSCSNGKFGGIVQTEIEQATLNLINANTLEINRSEFKGLTSTLKASAYLYGHKGSIGDLSKSIYYSTSYNNSFAWYSNSISINYNTNGGEGNYSSQTRDCSLKGYTIGSNANDIPSNNPTRNYYTFSGWYLDEQCTDGNEANGQIVYYSPTLYAKWAPIDYEINYVYNKYYNGDDASEASLPTVHTSTFNILSSNLILSQPTLITNGNNEIFDGWYFDSSFTIKIGTFNGSEAINYLQSNKITLYGRWYEYGTSIYTIKYINSNTDIECKEKDVLVSSNSSTFKLPELDEKNTDKDYQLYFDGWYSEETYINKISSGSDIHSDITLYAKWIKKNEFNVISNNITLKTYYLEANYTFTIPDPNDYDLTIPTGYKLFWTLSTNGVKYSAGDKIAIPNSWDQKINIIGTLELMKVKIALTTSNSSRYSYTIKILNSIDNSQMSITSSKDVEIGYVSTIVISVTPKVKYNLGIVKTYYKVTVTYNNNKVINGYNDSTPTTTDSLSITGDITITIDAS